MKKQEEFEARLVVTLRDFMQSYGRKSFKEFVKHVEKRANDRHDSHIKYD